MDKALTPQLTKALVIIATKKNEAIPKLHIDRLIELGYITKVWPKGWRLNSKGRDFMATQMPEVEVKRP